MSLSPGPTLAPVAALLPRHPAALRLLPRHLRGWRKVAPLALPAPQVGYEQEVEVERGVALTLAWGGHTGELSLLLGEQVDRAL